jgi:hypothetical protein
MGSGVSSLDAGWALWGRLNQQPWPHDEMSRGFEYFICEPAGGKNRHVQMRATVTEYQPFTQVDSLGDAYQKIQELVDSSGLDMSLSDWLANDYNVEKLAAGRWPLQLAFWLIDSEAIEPFWIEEIMDFRPGQTGWKRVAESRIPASAKRQQSA